MVVAETGCAHHGSVDELICMIEATARAGADAVKFQVRRPDFETDDTEQFRPGCETIQDETRAAYWRRHALPLKDWKVATAAAKDLGLVVGASVFSPEGVDWCVQLGVDYLKIGSGHVLDSDLESVAVHAGAPVVFSEGINKVHFGSFLNCHGLKLQCQSIYPTPHSLCRLYLEDDYDGFSCHTGTIEPVVDALSNGAQMVEVHVCYSKDQTGPDTSSSVTFEQLTQICRHRDFIREASNWTPDKEAQAAALIDQTRQAIRTGKRFNTQEKAE